MDYRNIANKSQETPETVLKPPDLKPLTTSPKKSIMRGK
jgi:hypothetical protein